MATLDDPVRKGGKIDAPQLVGDAKMLRADAIVGLRIAPLGGKYAEGVIMFGTAVRLA